MNDAPSKHSGHGLVRSALFVPGDRPERYGKALNSGADRVIIDFEDAVEESAKRGARTSLGEYLVKHPQVRVLVRINAPGHIEQGEDLAFCRRHAGVVGIMLPKAETAAQLKTAVSTGKPVLPIIESGFGAANLAELVAVPGLERLCFGAIDMALDLGLTDGSAGAALVLDQLRVSLILQSRINGLAPALDGVFPSISDDSGLTYAVQRAQQMGFGGVLCIHPKQVGTIHEALAPALEDVSWARRVLDAAQTQGGAFKLDGQMIDAPVLSRARRILGTIGN
ncbi:CoA ester lyase [Pseudomonas tolaasii]|uniref:HpcH/HpaI aldolase/citrate lyase family protein n=1 Tax=Pseudomonas tolaasii TaxID=29442 RepID=UPI001C586EC5|nr:CoA ester lyase [Pseudomonas tolaasii]MBW1248735.1 CoA ester lyase [Pseudomonas tolaasii]